MKALCHVVPPKSTGTLAPCRGSLGSARKLPQVQLGGEAALLRAGKVRHVLSLPASRGVAPHVASVLPIAVEAGADFELTVTGSNIADEDAQLLCRQNGTGRPLPPYQLFTSTAFLVSVSIACRGCDGKESCDLAWHNAFHCSPAQPRWWRVSTSPVCIQRCMCRHADIATAHGRVYGCLCW